jgi:hypothetical protein
VVNGRLTSRPAVIGNGGMYADYRTSRAHWILLGPGGSPTPGWTRSRSAADADVHMAIVAMRVATAGALVM